MDRVQLLQVGVILTAAIGLQGAIGFGAGLFAVPLMVWAGVELPHAIAVLLAAVIVQVALGCWQYRHHICWRNTLEINLWRFLSLPVGVAALSVLAGAGRDRAKQVVGAVLLLVLITQYVIKVRPRAHVHPAWTPVAGITSGLMAGAVGMGGPPVVLWMMAHDWSAKQSRAFLWSTFLVGLPLNLGLLAWTFGRPLVANFTLGLVYAPVVLVAATVGARLGDRLNRQRLRAVALCFLVAIAITSVVGPLLGVDV